MSGRIRPAVAFTFQEDTPYYRREERTAEVTFDKKQITFKAKRYGTLVTVHMSNNDFDEFLTWYNIAKGLEKARVDEAE